MAQTTTIDRAGRLVIPKPFRDKLRLAPGRRLHISEQDGRLVIATERTEARLVERDGYLVVDLGAEPPSIDAQAARAERIGGIVEYALRR